MKRSTFIGIFLIAVLALSACTQADENANMNDNTNTGGFSTDDTLGTPALSTPDTGGTTGTGTPAAGGTGGTAVSGTPSGGTGGTGTGTAQAGTPGVPVTGADCENVTVQLSTNVSAGTGGTSGTPSAGGTSSTPGATTTGTPATGTGGTSAGTATAMEPYLVDCNGMALYVFMEDTQDGDLSACTDADCIAEWPPLTVDEGEEPKAGEGVDETLLGTITRDDGTTQVTYNGWPLYLFADDIDAGDTLGQGDEDMWFLISADGEPIQQ